MTEKLWWAPGVNLGSIHHVEVLPPTSVFAWFALVPSGYSLGHLMDTDISTVNLEVQLCSVRPRQSWVQHDYKVRIISDSTSFFLFCCGEKMERKSTT